MSSNIAAVSKILASLIPAFGYADVRTACLKFASQKPSAVEEISDSGSVSSLESAAASTKKEKKEKISKPRGQSSWNILVAETLKEMREAYIETFMAEHPEVTEEAEIQKGVEKAITYKMAFARASEKKRESDPEAQKKYDAYLEKKAEKKAAKVSAGAAAASKVPLPASGNSSGAE